MAATSSRRPSGKSYTEESFRGKIVHPVGDTKNSGINDKKVLILDPDDCDFEIKVTNIFDRQTSWYEMIVLFFYVYPFFCLPCLY